VELHLLVFPVATRFFSYKSGCNKIFSAISRVAIRFFRLQTKMQRDVFQLQIGLHVIRFFQLQVVLHATRFFSCKGKSCHIIAHAVQRYSHSKKLCLDYKAVGLRIKLIL
jgi:hypothetical protein